MSEIYVNIKTSNNSCPIYCKNIKADCHVEEMENMLVIITQIM